MTEDPVCAAYSDRAAEYIALFSGDWEPHADDTALIGRHLTGLQGPVYDLGCGPGHWTAYLHDQGTAVTGVDLVPDFLEHARATYPASSFRLGSMTDVEGPAAGLLSWYSTIHLPPPELEVTLRAFRQVLEEGGVLVLGFFDSEDEVAPFDHKVLTAYRWPVDVMSDRLRAAGFAEVERLQQRFPERPDRAYAALAVRAV